MMDTTNSQEQSFININLRQSTPRTVAGSLAEWLNNPHLQVMSPTNEMIIIFLVKILQVQHREGQVFALTRNICTLIQPALGKT